MPQANVFARETRVDILTGDDVMRADSRGPGDPGALIDVTCERASVVARTLGVLEELVGRVTVNGLAIALVADALAVEYPVAQFVAVGSGAVSRDAVGRDRQRQDVRRQRGRRRGAGRRAPSSGHFLPISSPKSEPSATAHRRPAMRAAKDREALTAAFACVHGDSPAGICASRRPDRLLGKCAMPAHASCSPAWGWTCVGSRACQSQPRRGPNG